MFHISGLYKKYIKGVIMMTTTLLNNLVVLYGVIVYILVLGIIVYYEKNDTCNGMVCNKQHICIQHFISIYEKIKER